MTGANGKTYVPLPWLLGVMTAALIGMTAAWAKSIDADVDAIKKDHTIAETNQAILIANQEHLKEHLKQLQVKVDLLLEQGRSAHPGN